MEELRKRIEEIQAKHRIETEEKKPAMKSLEPCRPLETAYPRAVSERIEDKAFTIYRNAYTTAANDWFSPVAPKVISSLIALAKGGKTRKPLPERELLFFDIETTGLLGAGTVAFLVGFGRWRDSQFQITQFFLHDRELEEFMLKTIATQLSSARLLVTFNGKSFDVPVMQTRLVMNGMTEAADMLDYLPHLDLYSSVRKLGKHPLHKMNLQASVRRFLGIKRFDDILGSMIPALYYIYERDKNPSVLDPIFKHNCMDILDMAGLTKFMGLLFSKGQSFTKDAFALAGAGRIYVSKGHIKTARQFLQASVDCLHPSEVKDATPIRRLLATIMRKQGDWEEAASIWRSLIDGGQARFEDYLWLARYYEIHKGEIETSYGIVDRCVEFCLTSGNSLPHPVISRKRRLQKLSGR